MKIVYEYGFMFVLHTSGHVDTYNKNSVEAQKISQEQALIDAERDIKVCQEHLDRMAKTAPIVGTDADKESLLTRFIRRLKNALG